MWRNGRRTRFRCVRGNSWGFESLHRQVLKQWKSNAWTLHPGCSFGTTAVYSSSILHCTAHKFAYIASRPFIGKFFCKKFFCDNIVLLKIEYYVDVALCRTKTIEYSFCERGGIRRTKWKLNIMSTWRNRYTRTFEGRVGKPVRVQVPPSTIKKRVTFVTLFLICLNGEDFNPFLLGSADLRTDGVNEVKRVRWANRLSRL